MLGGRELIEEGSAPAPPVFVFSDQAHFSGSTQLSVNFRGDGTIVKRFITDTISKKWNDTFFVDNTL